MSRRTPDEPQAPASGLIRDGGARPDIAPEAPVVVAFPHDYPPSSIVIDTSGRRLYYVLGNKQAYMYPISVGREGFNWTGTETISRTAGLARLASTAGDATTGSAVARRK